MTKITRVLSLFCLIISSLSSVKADATGSEITYRQIYPDSTVYEIQITLYRDCNTAAFGSIDSLISITCPSSSSSTNLSPTLVSIRDVTSLCGKTHRCSPGNTSFVSPGIEELIYLDTVDFGLSPFSTYASCSETIIQYNECCRSSALTTGLGNSNQYNYAAIFFSNFSNNTSSKSLTFPLSAVIEYEATRYINNQENTDGDSLSFEMVAPLTSYGNNASYSSGYNANEPLTFYYFGGASYPTNNPSANPPIGVYFDSETGDLVFTSAIASERTAIVIEATEWRKDNSGTYKKVGLTRREMSVESGSNSNNNLPKLNTPNLVSGCIGEEINVFVEATDIPYIPPPPAATPDPDTLEYIIQCDYPITFYLDSVSYVNSSYLKGKITFNTDSFSSVPEEFDIIVTAFESKNCAGYNSVSKRIRVKTYPESNTSTQISSIGCGQYVVEPVDLDSFNSIPAFVQFKILDQLKTTVYSSSIGSSLMDTFRMTSSGKFYIESSAGFSLDCKNLFIDSFEVDATDVYPLPTQSNFLACYTDTFQLQVNNKWKSAIWSTGDTAYAIDVTQPGTYTVSLEDSCSSFYSHTFNVSFREFISDVKGTEICNGDSASFSFVPGSNISWTWSNGSKDTNISLSNGGDYFVTVYDSTCFYSFNDSFTLTELIPPIADITDTVAYICNNTALVLRAAYDPSYSYRWTNGSTADTSKVSLTGWNVVTATNACGSSKDSILVFVKFKPVVSISGDSVMCRTDSVLLTRTQNSDYTYQWNTGSTSTTLYATQQQEYFVVATNICGSDTDQINCFIVDTPHVNLGPDTAIIEFDIINVKNRTPSSFATYQWNIGSNSDNIDIRNEGTYWLTETNACGTSSDTIKVRFKLSVKELKELGYSFYPNPASNQITIGNQFAQKTEMRIYSLEGVEIQRFMFSGLQNTIDVSALAKGTYILRLSASNDVATGQLIIY